MVACAADADVATTRATTKSAVTASEFAPMTLLVALNLLPPLLNQPYRAAASEFNPACPSSTPSMRH